MGSAVAGNTAAGFVPKKLKLDAFGVVAANKVMWPSSDQLHSLDLGKKIKLSGVEFGTDNSELTELRLLFTGGVKSILFRCAAKKRAATSKSIEIDTSKTISDVYINQAEDTGAIFGLRLLDNLGGYLVNEHWQKQSSKSGSAWKHFKIPEDKQVIGVHGSHDGESFKNLGLFVWKPNPTAI